MGPWNLWQPLLFASAIRDIAVSPHDPRVVYAVSGDGYLWVYREPAATPAQLP